MNQGLKTTTSTQAAPLLGPLGGLAVPRPGAFARPRVRRPGVTRRDAAENRVFERLERVHEAAPALLIPEGERVVILSDLHMGDGSRRDDFLHNASLVEEALGRCYLDGGWRLVLNGDVEELVNFSLEAVVARWGSTIDLFRQFHREGRLAKVLGNHDEDLPAEVGRYPFRPELLGALRLSVGPEELFILHGHQGSNFYQAMHRPAGWLMRNVVSPLGFKNIRVSDRQRRRIKIEHVIYEFARRAGLPAIIGHTHRPLFESLSKVDSLRFQIEQQCREAAHLPAREQRAAAARIAALKREFEECRSAGKGEGSLASVYDPDLVVPCLFNSGCCIGKGGFTAIEVEAHHIALVHWRRADDADAAPGRDTTPASMAAGLWRRVVLRRECLRYVTTRIRLLGG